MKDWISSQDKLIKKYMIILLSDLCLPISCILWVVTGSFFEKMGFVELLTIIMSIFSAANCVVYFFIFKYIKKPFVYSYKDLENDKKKYQNFFEGIYIFSALIIAVIAAYEKIKRDNSISISTYLSVISAFVFFPRVCKFALEINKFETLKNILKN